MALDDALARDPSVIVLGEDIAIPNGPFGATKGLHAKYPSRVLDTPISESAMIGAALGASILGMRPVVEIMYADFLMVAMDQIVNQVANTRYVSKGRLAAPLVIRTQQGSTPGSCAQHSQSLEGLFAHVPGLRVACPSTPADAYQILRFAIDCDDPVMVFESRRLYPMKGPVDTAVVQQNMGRAETFHVGSDATVVTWGTGRQCVQDAVRELADEGILVDALDLRWIAPWDREAVVASVARTQRLLVVHEAARTGGFGAEIVSTVVEDLGPMVQALSRIGLQDVPVPSSPFLSSLVLPTSELVRQAVVCLVKES